MENDIIEAIPDPEFAGIGVLDFEEWFATWDMNFKGNDEELYKNLSIAKAKRDHPELTDMTEIEAIAKDEYNTAAR